MNIKEETHKVGDLHAQAAPKKPSEIAKEICDKLEANEYIICSYPYFNSYIGFYEVTIDLTPEQYSLIGEESLSGPLSQELHRRFGNKYAYYGDRVLRENARTEGDWKPAPRAFIVVEDFSYEDDIYEDAERF